MTGYFEHFPQLRHVVLEDSWVLGVYELTGAVVIKMDLVYASEHPELRLPRAGERVYSREGILQFTGVSEFQWTDRRPPAKEPDGSTSWNGIDRVERQSDTVTLEGEVGLLRIRAKRFDVIMTGPE